MIWIVYDERMFKMPFHLARHRDRYLYELYEVNCVHSLKLMGSSSSRRRHAHIYTRRRITESGTTFLPMKVVASEEEMKKLLERFGSGRVQNEQFDLLLLLVNPEHKGKKNK